MGLLFCIPSLNLSKSDIFAPAGNLINIARIEKSGETTARYLILHPTISRIEVGRKNKHVTFIE